MPHGEPLSRHWAAGPRQMEVLVVVLGVVLIILGLLVASLHVLLIIGVILLVVGLILNFVPIGGTRRRYY
jgi:membrane-bound ClpP family serine protease